MAEQHSSKGIMWATIGIAVVLIAIIYPLTNKSFNTVANSGTGSDEADIRIQPVAKFELAKAEAPTASGPGVAKPSSTRFAALVTIRVRPALQRSPTRAPGHRVWLKARMR
jgi:hypothetical protein